MIQIYTDGGCRNNPGIGAWAFVAVEDGIVTITPSMVAKYTTNNEMELSAILNALEYLQLCDVSEATIFSDSQYAVNTINIWYPQWLKQGSLKDKKNVDLLQRISSLKSPKIGLQWVRGHADNKYNILADQLVNQAMDALSRT